MPPGIAEMPPDARRESFSSDRPPEGEGLCSMKVPAEGTACLQAGQHFPEATAGAIEDV